MRLGVVVLALGLVGCVSDNDTVLRLWCDSAHPPSLKQLKEIKRNMIVADSIFVHCVERYYGGDEVFRVRDSSSPAPAPN